MSPSGKRVHFGRSSFHQRVSQSCRVMRYLETRVLCANVNVRLASSWASHRCRRVDLAPPRSASSLPLGFGAPGVPGTRFRKVTSHLPQRLFPHSCGCAWLAHQSWPRNGHPSCNWSRGTSLVVAPIHNDSLPLLFGVCGCGWGGNVEHASSVVDGPLVGRFPMDAMAGCQRIATNGKTRDDRSCVLRHQCCTMSPTHSVYDRCSPPERTCQSEPRLRLVAPLVRRVHCLACRRPRWSQTQQPLAYPEG